MKPIVNPVLLIKELAKEQPLYLSGAKVEDSGHCKYCINAKNYCNWFNTQKNREASKIASLFFIYN